MFKLHSNKVWQAALLRLCLFCSTMLISSHTLASIDVTGEVIVTKRNFFGNVVKRDDRSGVLIYVTGFTSKPSEEVVKLNQKNKTFTPKLLPVIVGQKVSFPNQDNIYHNVFSVSPVQSFDLGQYKKGDSPAHITFDKPGLVPVYCNIHPNMIAYVAVLENHAYAITDTNGRFTLNDLPKGTFKIHAWTEGAQPVEQVLVIGDKPPAPITLKVSQTQRLKSHKRKDNTAYPVEDAYDVYND